MRLDPGSARLGASWTLAFILACAGCFTSDEHDAAPAPASMPVPTLEALAQTQDEATKRPDDLNRELEPIRAQYELPSLAAAVWRKGKLLGQGAVGLRKIGDPTPIGTDDVWHLGSCVKAMTATLIGVYVDRKRMHFEDTIASVFAGETVDPAYRDVTIEQFLQHRGGAPSVIPSDVAELMQGSGPPHEVRLTAVRALLSRPPAQAPGTFAYANVGYMIAGAALERVVGLPWEGMIQQDLFAPLHMASCGFGAPGTPGMVDEPWGHGWDGTRLVPVQLDNPPSFGPAGTVHCGLADWGRFLRLHAARSGGNGSLVSKSTMRRLHTPPPGGDYAAGWNVLQGGSNGTQLGHSGSNTLFYVTTLLMPERGELVFAVATNRGGTPAAQGVKERALAVLTQKYAP